MRAPPLWYKLTMDSGVQFMACTLTDLHVKTMTIPKAFEYFERHQNFTGPSHS
jgi:hypothetical protein